MQGNLSIKPAENNVNPSRIRQHNYYSILGMKRRMLHLAGIDGRDADTILAICASLPHTATNPGALDFTPAAISNIAIGNKLCLKTRERDHLERSASRRLARLFETGQPKAGIEFITRIAGTLNPATGRWSMHRYIDNFTPRADQAHEEFIRTRADKTAWNKLTVQEKAALFDLCAAKALAKIPAISPAEQGSQNGVDAKKPIMDLASYTQQRERQVIASIEATIQKIEADYKDEQPQGAAYALLQRLHTQLWGMMTSQRKLMNGGAKDKPSLFPPPSALVEAGDVKPITDEQREERDRRIAQIKEECRERARAKFIQIGEKAHGGDTGNQFAFKPDVEDKRGGEEEEKGVKLPDNSRTEEEAEFDGIPDKMSPPPADNSNEFPHLWTPPKIDTFLDYAKQYLDLGWKLTLNYGLRLDGSCSCKKEAACAAKGKHPLGGAENVYTDLRQVGREMGRLPLYLGLATGQASGVTVLDFDGKAGLDLLKEWQDKGWIDSACLMDITGSRKGKHVFVTFIPGLKSLVKPVPGLDIRNEGSQVVLPPSLHISGNAYEWVNWPAKPGKPSPELVEYLLSLKGEARASADAKPEKKPGRTLPRPGGDLIPPADLGDQSRFRVGYQDGERNYRLFKKAAALRGANASWDQALKEMRESAALCKPPLEVEEVESILSKAWARYVPNALKEKAEAA